jgi:hypothetical protein
MHSSYVVFSENYEIVVADCLAAHGLTVISNFMRSGHGAEDSSSPYALLHINPPKNVDGSHNFTGLRVLSFASDTIYKKLMVILDKSILAQAIRTFNAGEASRTYGASSAGVLFEKMCLWSCPLTNKTLDVIQLDSLSSTASTVLTNSVTFPSSIEELPRNWTSGNVLLPDILYIPRSCNLESGDAFCLLSAANFIIW